MFSKSEATPVPSRVLAEVLTPLVRPLITDAVEQAVARSLEECVSQGGRPREWMTRQQCADYLGISLPTLDRVVRTQELPWHPLGDCKRFRLDEVREWLTARKAEQH